MIPVLAASLVLAASWTPDRVVGQGWGLNLGFNDLSTVERRKIADSGVKWVRRDLFWHVVEPKKGIWDWSVYDRLLSVLEPKGIKPVFILCYGNGLYQSDAPRTPEARAAFCRYVRKAVDRYKGKGIIWEIWNEPNNHHWQPKSDVQEYVKLDLEASRVFKAAAPNEKLVGPGLAGFDWPFIEACFKAGVLNYWDGVTVHPYRPMEPESGVPDYARLMAMIESYAPRGKKVPLLCGEIGFSDTSVRDKDQQADYFLRQYLVNLASGVPLTIWYNWSDNGIEPQNPEHHYGIVGPSPGFHEKPAYTALKALTSTLKGYRYSKRLAFGGPDDWILLFTKGNNSALAAWTTSQHPSRVPIELNLQTLQVRSQSGRPVQKTTPVLTGSPQIILCPPNWKPRWVKAAELPLFLTVDTPAELAARLAPFKSKWVELKSERSILKGPLTAKSLSRLARFSDRSRTLHDLVITLDGLPQRVSLNHSSPIDLTAASEGLTGSITISPVRRGFTGSVEVISEGKTRSLPVSIRPGSSTKVAVYRPSSPFSIRLLFGSKLARQEGPWQMIPVSLADVKTAVEGDGQVDGSAKAVQVLAKDGPAKGGQSLLIDYAFGKGWKYALLSPPKPIPIQAGTDRLTYWVKGTGTGVLLLMRYQDSTGQTFQPEGVPVDWTGWRAITFSLDGSTGGRWGGANDGKVHLPIRITSLAVLDNPRGMGMSGALELSAPTLIRTITPKIKGN